MPKPKGTEAWRQQVAIWLDGQELHPTSSFWYRPDSEAADGRPCDCCGSKRPETLYAVADSEGRRYTIGANCWSELERTDRYHVKAREKPPSETKDSQHYSESYPHNLGGGA